MRLGDGRLGRAWEHAGALRGLAETVVKDVEGTEVLEEYWSRWREEGGGEEEGSKAKASVSPKRRRSRGLSSLTMNGPSSKQRLSPYHPAYSVLSYLDTFGPLAFPLHRIALLRKRVLIITPVPVKSPCEFGMLLVSHILHLQALIDGWQYTTSPSCPPSQTRYNSLRPRNH